MGDILSAFFIYLALFLGTYLCAYLPSCICASPKVMNYIALFGGATIVGTALIIVFPEASSIIINAQRQLDVLDGNESTEVVPKSV